MTMPSHNKTSKWIMVLYIAGHTPRCIAALSNLKKLCDEHLPGHYTIEIIDLLKQPELAKEHQIFAIPTLIRKLPKPIRKAIGDLSNKERIISSLELCYHEE